MPYVFWPIFLNNFRIHICIIYVSFQSCFQPVRLGWETLYNDLSFILYPGTLFLLDALGDQEPAKHPSHVSTPACSLSLHNLCHLPRKTAHGLQLIIPLSVCLCLSLSEDSQGIISTGKLYQLSHSPYHWLKGSYILQLTADGAPGGIHQVKLIWIQASPSSCLDYSWWQN